MESARIAAEKAKAKFLSRRLSSPENIAMVQYEWIGVVDEMVFELATSLIYELAPDDDESQFGFFTNPDSNLFYHLPLGILTMIDFPVFLQFNNLTVQLCIHFRKQYRSSTNDSSLSHRCP